MAAGSISYRSRSSRAQTFGVYDDRPQNMRFFWQHGRVRIRWETDTGKELSIILTPSEAVCILDNLKANEAAIRTAGEQE